MEGLNFRKSNPNEIELMTKARVDYIVDPQGWTRT